MPKKKAEPEPETITTAKAIRQFFGEVTMEELKALDAKERKELGIMSATALGIKWVPKKAKS